MSDGSSKNGRLKSALNEIESLTSLRTNWTGGMGLYNQIFIPLVIVVITIMFANIGYFSNRDFGFYFLLIGGLFIILIMSVWRAICLHVDRQIVKLYPRWLELEEIAGYELFTSYFYNNLSKEGRKKLADLLINKYKYKKDKKDILVNKIKDEDFREYKIKLNQIKVKRLKKGKKKITPQETLLEVWDSFKPKYIKSVTSRGHVVFNIFAILVPVVYYIIVLIGFKLGIWV